jgi:hypothetical protein
MKLTELFLNQLTSEEGGTRRVLERVPEGRNGWKPHEKSMPLGYLSALVAGMPGWIAFMVNRDELDIASAEGAKFKPQIPATNRELLDAFDESLAKARRALEETTDQRLMAPWKFIVAGHVADERPR